MYKGFTRQSDNDWIPYFTAKKVLEGLDIDPYVIDDMTTLIFHEDSKYVRKNAGALLAKKRAYWARAKSRKSFGKPPRLRHRPAHVGRVFRL